MVLLNGPREVIFSRMAARRDHYMPTSLLDSQLATLKQPQPNEADLSIVCVDRPPDAVFLAAKSRLFPDK